MDRVQYKGSVIKLPKDYKPMDRLTVREIMVKSSNRGVAQMAMCMGENKLYDYSKAFGFGEITGYGSGGEVRGIVL